MRLAESSKSSVPCLARPAICFGSSDVVPPLTAHALATLLAQFRVRVGHASCTGTAWLPVGTCNGTAAIPGYVLGFIVTAERRVHLDQRPGTQVILFGIRPT
ncbi:MAG: hypothetical protein ACLP0L_03060 [Solirubrobacteraceae bacterium]